MVAWGLQATCNERSLVVIYVWLWHLQKISAQYWSVFNKRTSICNTKNDKFRQCLTFTNGHSRCLRIWANTTAFTFAGNCEEPGNTCNWSNAKALEWCQYIKYSAFKCLSCQYVTPNSSLSFLSGYGIEKILSTGVYTWR